MAMTLSIPRDAERDCRDRDLAHLAAALDDDLAEVWVFGSVARLAEAVAAAIASDGIRLR